jgi:predicted P-loop ATPase
MLSVNHSGRTARVSSARFIGSLRGAHQHKHLVEFAPRLTLFDVVLRDEARRNSFHLLDYLSGLQWDGKPRIETWLFDYGGAPRRDEGYNRYLAAVGRIILIAGKRRPRSAKLTTPSS